MPGDLISGADTIKKFLTKQEIEGLQAQTFELITELISGAIEERLNRTILETTFTETYDGTGDNELLLYNYPVTEVTSVVDGDGVTLVQGTDFLLYARIPSLKMIDGIWINEDAYYTVTYKAGYALADIPKSLIMAACMWFAEVFNQAKSDAFGVVSDIKFGDQVISYVSDGPSAAVEKLLKPFKRSHYVTTRC